MKNEFPIPGRLFEIVDGMLIVLLAVMLLFAIIHLVDLWHEHRLAYLGKWGRLRTMMVIYNQYKPSVALLVIIVSLWMRFAILWYLRHLRGLDLPPDDFVARWGVEVFLLANIGLVLGVICWIRNISPYPLANWQWVVLIVLSLGFGYFMSLHDLHPILHWTRLL